MSGVCSAHRGHEVGCAQCESGMVVANREARGLVPGWGGTIAAQLVWDGTDEVRIPPCMGTPREDQMQGTALERLIELCGRICYDSLGVGRSSAKYHENIRDTRHLSTTEGAVRTVEITFADYVSVGGRRPSDYRTNVLIACLNRPSLFVRCVGEDRVRITLNVRHAYEWDRRPPGRTDLGTVLGLLFAADSSSTEENLNGAPAYCGDAAGVTGEAAENLGIESALFDEPETDQEKWISLYVSGSRGWSHELVRHGDWTAISQRSTRYVDESESDWVMHPLVEQFLREHPARPIGDRLHLSTEPHERVHDGLAEVRREAAHLYDDVVAQLEAWLLPKLVAKGDPYAKTSARKQARGAARGVLGNALQTELIFSASVAQWRWMLQQRAADAADAEIRACFVRAVLPELKRSRYGDRFSDLEVGPASDGIGESLYGGGNR